ncbi:AI-2E family transporter [Aquimarina sp. ERC-38]|nr:AI-2E family transporter [Aquimarina sp. ERC-38]
MRSKTIANGIVRAVFILAFTCLFFVFLYTIQSILIYILIAIIISLIGRPLVIFFRKYLKLNTGIAVIITLLLISAIFSGIFLLFIPILSEQGQLLSEVNLIDLNTNLNKLNSQISEYFHIEEVNLVDIIKESNISNFLNLKSLPTAVNSLFSGFGSLLIGLFSVLFIAFFLLKDSKLLEKSLLVFAKKKEHETKFRHALETIKELLSRYFLGLLLQVFILFILYTIVFSVFDVNNAIAVALIAAIFNLIPYVGPLMGCAFVLILTTTSHLGEDFSTVILPKLGYILLGYIIIQLIDNFINQPFIFGNSVKSHPLEIFLVILIFGASMGIGGLIIAVPAYTVIKVIAKEFLSKYKVVKQLTKEI